MFSERRRAFLSLTKKEENVCTSPVGPKYVAIYSWYYLVIRTTRQSKLCVRLFSLFFFETKTLQFLSLFFQIFRAI